MANSTLKRMRAEALPGVEVRASEELGAPGATKEAIAFALIGYLSWHGLPGNVPSCTGASGPRVLGSMTATAVARSPLPAGRPGGSPAVAPRSLRLTATRR